MEDGKCIARNAEGETYYVPANTTYEQWKEMQEKDEEFIENGGNSGIIIAGGITGGLDPTSERATAHAIQYYESVRHMTNDANRIAKNTGFSKDKV